MLSKKMQKALNDQINAEMASGYIYLSMSNSFELQNLPGMAAWMKAQAGEELGHALKIYGYIHSRNAEPSLAAIAAPQAGWDGPLAAFQDAYKHEQYISGRINKLVELARAEKDYATEVFLNWFVEEQVEEESSALAVVEKLKMIGDHRGGLYMLDRELGSRGAGH